MNRVTNMRSLASKTRVVTGPPPRVKKVLVRNDTTNLNPDLDRRDHSLSPRKKWAVNRFINRMNRQASRRAR